MYQRTEQEIMKNWQGELDKPVVSVCCTTYNHEPYIAEAIDGFLMQESDFPFEILIRDDCSTDKTASIVKAYADKYPNLVKPVFEKENTYSKGIRPMPQLYKIAKGKYIALCEGDDYWTDALKLLKQVNFLEENKEYALCYTGATEITDDGTVLKKNKNFGDSDEEDLIAGIGAAITGSMMFRSFDNSELSKYNVLNGDTLLWHCLGFYGKCKYLDNIGDSVYRIHAGGIWSSRDSFDKLVASIHTFRVIRSRIVENFQDNSKLLNKHDKVYYKIFTKYFFETIKRREFEKTYKGIIELKKLHFINKLKVYFLTFEQILKLIYEKLKIYKIKQFIRAKKYKH